MEIDDKKELRKWTRLGLVIGLIALCGGVGGVGALGAFICFMEFQWGLLALSILAFSCSVGAGYVLVNYYYVLMEKKETEDKERKALIEEEIEKKYESRFTELEHLIEREGHYIQRSIEDARIGVYR